MRSYQVNQPYARPALKSVRCRTHAGAAVRRSRAPVAALSRPQASIANGKPIFEACGHREWRTRLCPSNAGGSPNMSGTV